MNAITYILTVLSFFIFTKYSNTNNSLSSEFLNHKSISMVGGGAVACAIYSQ